MSSSPALPPSRPGVSTPRERPALVSVDSAASAAIRALREPWQAIGELTPLASYAWYEAAAAAFPNASPLVLTAPGACAAFFRDPASGFYMPLGAELYEPTEFPLVDEAAAEALASQIAGLEQPVLIRDLFASSPLLAPLRRAAGRRLVVTPAEGHPFLDLDDSWLEPESHLNSGRRSDLRRARRHAERDAPVRCEFLAPSPHELPPLLEELFAVESAGWKGARGSGLANDAHVGGFYRRLALAASHHGTLRLGVLRIGPAAAAMQIAIEEHGRFWLFKMGFDERFARLSPGALLMVESLRGARQRGCSRFELMGHSAAWNQIWNPAVHAAVCVELQLPTLRGWTSVLARHAKRYVQSRLR